MRDVVVVGSGVIGLTTAIVLLEHGARVKIVTKEHHGQTTSANSGAIWGPFLSTVDARVESWSFRTFQALSELSKVAGSGVYLTSGACVSENMCDIPNWVISLNQDYFCDLSKFPQKYVMGWRYQAPIIDMPHYLSYLEDRFVSHGGVIASGYVLDFSELANEAGWILNCSGLGSRELANDPEMTVSKGQLVVMENPGLSEFFAERGDGPELLYILPQKDKVVLGGTAELAYSHSDVDQPLVQRIIDRCVDVEPKLKTVKPLGYRVGFRPCRPKVRLEAVFLSEGVRVVHNYGHGGSGVSLSWACAEDALKLILNS